MHMFAFGKRVVARFLVALGFFAVPFFSYAAELQFSPTTGSVELDEEVSVAVKVVPGGDDVNAADGTVTFDASLLSVASISKDGSAFSLWTAEPSFSNSAGTVTFSGGTPSAFRNTGTVITIKFKGKKVGSAKLAFSKGSVLAADGKGTDVYTAGGEATIEVKEAAPDTVTPEEPAGEEAGDASVVPIAPNISSKTHAKLEQWYATSTADFAWKNPIDVTGVRILFSDKEDAIPNINLKVTDVTHTETNIGDGTWYFLVQIKNEFGWGAVGKKKILVDTTPPLDFDFTLKTDGEIPRFVFGTEDKASGVDRYEIAAGSTTLATLRVSDLTEGGAPVPAQPGGVQKITMRAFDKAGNMTEVTKEVDLPKVEKAKKGEEVPSIWTWERILLILLAVSTTGLGTSLYYTRKNAQEEHSKILKDVIEVRDKNDKVFGAMREEFEQMIQDFDEKPQLTPQERDLLERVKEVLDISEELVDTGIENLKKTVKGQ